MKKKDTVHPVVSRNFLLFLAGAAWLAVGTMLLHLAFSWLSEISNTAAGYVVVLGVVIALVVHHLGFLKIVNTNVKRILALGDKASVFLFIPWKSYLIIALMIVMGAILRRSSIPKHYLVVLYITMGLALVLSSVRYMRILLQEIRRRKRKHQSGE